MFWFLAIEMKYLLSFTLWLYLYHRLALLVRRVHDFGKSGWFVLVMIFVPTIALIVGLLFIQTSKELGMLFLIIALALFFYFVFLPIFKKGDEGENAYGSDPKALNL